VGASHFRFVKVFFGAASEASEAVAAAAAVTTQDTAGPATVAAAPAAATPAASTGAPASAAAPVDGGAARSTSPVKAPAAATSPGWPSRGPAAATSRPPPARPAPHVINAAEAQRRAALQAKQELQKKQSEILAETLTEHKKVMEQAQQLQAAGGSPDAIRELVKRATELAELSKSLMAAALATAQAGPPVPTPSASRLRPGGGQSLPPRPSSYKLDQRSTRILVRNVPESHRTTAALRQHFSVGARRTQVMTVVAAHADAGSPTHQRWGFVLAGVRADRRGRTGRGRHVRGCPVRVATGRRNGRALRICKGHCRAS